MIMTMVKMVVMMLMMLTWQSDGYLNVPPLHGDPSGDDDDAIHGSPSSVIRLETILHVNLSLLGSQTICGKPTSVYLWLEVQMGFKMHGDPN